MAISQAMDSRTQSALSVSVDRRRVIPWVSALVGDLAIMKLPAAERIVRDAIAISVLAVLIYWFLWCCACPVTNGDSRVYNLARLWLLERGGLFGNSHCLWSRHLTFPWTFDAAHYPFLYLHRGYEVPSFICFLGILAAAYRMMQDRFGRDAGLVAIAGLLGLPMLVYQAVNTKNDLVIVFGVMVWFYALAHYVRRPSRLHIAMAALAIAVVVGSKTSGLVVAALALAVTPLAVPKVMWHRRHTAWFIGTIFIGLFFWSSWEIYLNNKLQFGSWLGDMTEYRSLVNHDGWRGILANHIRFIFSSCDLFIVPRPVRVAVGQWKGALGEKILSQLGLTGAGIARLTLYPVGERDFLRVCKGVYAEATSTFGLLGMLTLFAAPIALVIRRRWDLTCRFAAFSLATFIILVSLMGWHPSGHRYLLVPFAFGFCAMAGFAYGSNRQWTIWALRCIALASLWLVPIVSVSKPIPLLPTAFSRPLDLLPSAETTVRKRLDKVAADKQLPLLLYCGPRAHIFYVFDRLRDNVIPIVKFDDVVFDKLKSRYGRNSFSVLVMNAEAPAMLSALEPLDSKGEERNTNPDTDILAVWGGSQ